MWVEHEGGFWGFVTAIWSRQLRVAKRLGPLFDLSPCDALMCGACLKVHKTSRSQLRVCVSASVSTARICSHICVWKFVVCLWCNFLNALPNGETGKTVVQRRRQLKRWMKWGPGSRVRGRWDQRQLEKPSRF